MKDETLRSILAGIAEGAIPSAEIDLWQKLSARLEESEPTSRNKGSRVKSIFAHMKPAGRAALMLLALALALAALLATPLGQALAREIIHFFTPATSDSLPVQPWQLSPLPGSDPEAGSETQLPLTLDRAKSLAGFPILLPAETEGHPQCKVDYDAERKTVTVTYCDPEIGIGNGFTISQQPLGAYAQDPSRLEGVVGASAQLQAVRIGGLTGEYVQGVWKLTDTGPVWEPDPFLQRVRWKTDTRFFEIVYQGNRLTENDLIAIAASIKP